MVDVEATMFEVQPTEIAHNDQETTSKNCGLDCILDDEPLGFEKCPLTLTKKMQAQDPFEEVDLGCGTNKRPTYISGKLDPSLKIQVSKVLKEIKYCFVWDYDEMPGISWDLVELKLPIKPDKRLVKPSPSLIFLIVFVFFPLRSFPMKTFGILVPIQPFC